MQTPKGNENFGLLKAMIVRMRKGPYAWRAKDLANALIEEHGHEFEAEFLDGKTPEKTVLSYFTTNREKFGPSASDEGATYRLLEMDGQDSP